MKHVRLAAAAAAYAPILNIGLARNDGAGTVDPEEALSVLRWTLGRTVGGWQVAQSATEPTLIVDLDSKLTPAEGELLAARLHQDCIAQFDGADGQLYGPNAEAWGPFNPAYFLLWDGQPLQRQAA